MPGAAVPPAGRRVADRPRLARVRRSSALVIGAIGLLAGCTLTGASLEDGPGLEGTYIVNGEDPLGFEYSGTVTIVAADAPDTYELEWIVTGTIQQGTGVLDGDVLRVTWSTSAGARGDSAGEATYVVGDDGVLRGTRVVVGVDEEGTEEIFPEP